MGWKPPNKKRRWKIEGIFWRRRDPLRPTTSNNVMCVYPICNVGMVGVWRDKKNCRNFPILTIPFIGWLLAGGGASSTLFYSPAHDMVIISRFTTRVCEPGPHRESTTLHLFATVATTGWEGNHLLNTIRGATTDMICVCDGCVRWCIVLHSYRVVLDAS